MSDSNLEVLTVEEVASLLRLHEQTVLKLLNDGKLKGVLVGRKWRISSEAVAEYLRGTGPRPRSPKAELPLALNPLAPPAS